MAARNKTSSPRTGETLHWEEILAWLRSSLPRSGEWQSFFQQLQDQIQKLLKERLGDFQEQQSQLFMKAVETIVQKYGANLTPLEKAKIYLEAGCELEASGAWDKALAAFQAAIEVCQSRELSQTEAEAQRWCGHIYSMRNQWQAAESAYQHSLALCNAAGDEIGAAYAYSSLGILSFEQGQFEQASRYWEDALVLAEKHEETKLMAQVYNNMGALANVCGKQDEALAHYSKCLPMFEKIGERRGMAETYHNMGMTYADMQLWADAGIHYERSYQVAREVGDLRLQATIKVNRAELYLNIGDVALTQEMCLQALATFEKLQDRLGVAEAHKILGRAYRVQKRWKQARTQLDTALKMAKQFNNPLCEAEVHLEYGKLFKAMRKKKSAVGHLQKALAFFTEMKAQAEVAEVQRELTALT